MSIEKIEIKGLETIKDFFEKVDKKVSSVDKLYDKVGRRIINEAVFDHFAKKENPDGKPWEKLNADYEEQKIEKKGVSDILIWNGELRDSVGCKTENLKLFIGAGNEDIPYAKIHNEGGKAGRNKNVEIPKREYLGFGNKEEQIINEEIKNWIGVF
jgi:phage virion morphogenesis protein